MTTSRRAFLSSLAIAAAAPAVITGALAAPPASTIDLRAFALWCETYSHADNPAWVFYDLLVERYGVDAVDRESCAQLAALCDEPVAS